MQERRNIILAALAGLSVTASVTGLIIASKPHQVLPGASIPVSMWLFPFIYVFGTITTEIYGPSIARWVTIVAFTCTVISVLYYALAVVLPAPAYWDHQEAYKLVLLATPRIFVASVIAYLLTSYANIGVLVGVKKLTGGRWMWFRILVAAIISQATDSICFVGLAFWGVLPSSALLPMMGMSTVFKVAMQIVGIPVSYGITNFVKEKI